MKRTENEQAMHDELNKIRRRRARLAEKVSKQKGRPVAWVGGRLYFTDGKMEKVRSVPDLPKPGREAVGWKRQLPKGAVKTIAKATKAEMQAIVVAPQPEPAPTPQPQLAPEPPTQALKASVGELVDLRLATLAGRREQALRLLAEK